MPQNVDLGEHYGIVAFPDEYTPEQIVKDYEGLEALRLSKPPEPTTPPPRASDLSVVDYARNVGGSLLRGIGNTIASIPEGIAISREAIPGLLPAPVRSVTDPLVNFYNPFSQTHPITGGLLPDIQNVLRGSASGIRSGTRAISGEPEPDLAESYLATRIPEGVGSALGFAAGGLAGRAAKIPTWLSLAGLGSAAGSSEFYNDAKSKGADEPTAQLASVVGNVVGTSEAIPLARIMRRLDGITGNTFSKFVWESTKSTLEEAMQEGGQQLAQNFTARQLYDRDRELFDSVIPNAAVGGATGFLLSALAQGIGIPIGRSRMRREGTERRRSGVAQFESERIANAQSLGTIPQTPSQEAAVGQEADESLRLRLPTENGVEAEPRTALVQEVVDAVYNRGRVYSPAKPSIIESDENVSPSLHKLLRRSNRQRLTLSDVLQNIATHSAEYGEMAASLLKTSDRESLNVVVYRDDETNRSYYDTQLDYVGVAREDRRTWVFIHEAMHALTSRKLLPIPKYKGAIGQAYINQINAVQSDRKTSKPIRDLIDLYKVALVAFDQEYKTSLLKIVGDSSKTRKAGAFYGLGDIHEFVAEAFSRRAFQEWLDSLPGPKRTKSVWRGIIDALREMVGMPEKQTSLLQRVLEAGAQVAAQKREPYKVFSARDSRLGSERQSVPGQPYIPTLRSEAPFVPPPLSEEEAPQELITKLWQSNLSDKPLTVKRVLAYIAKSSPEFGAMARQLISIGDADGLSVRVVFNASSENSFYDARNDYVSINPKQTKTFVFIHEILHALTVRKISPYAQILIRAGLPHTGQAYRDAINKVYQDPDLSPALKRIIDLYEHAIVAYEQGTGGTSLWANMGDAKKSVENGGFYGLGNLEEFITEAFSNRQFQKFLDMIPVEGKQNTSIWREIVDAIRQFFGAEATDGSFLQIVLEAGANLAQEKRPPIEQWWARSGGNPAKLPKGPGGRLYSQSQSPSVFRRRSQVVAATTNPGLATEDAQQAEAIAAAQSGMVTSTMANWLQVPPADKIEKAAKKILQPLLDAVMMSPVPRPLSSFPEGTTEEKRTKELAGWTQLAHHGFHRDLALSIDQQIDADQVAMAEAMAKTSATTQAQHKANFATATFHRLTSSMRDYIASLAKKATGSLQAQWNAKITQAENRLNEHEQSPTAIKNALSAIARTIPDNLLTPTINLTLGSNVDTGPLETSAFNQPVIDWAVQNGALFGVVSDSIQEWLLVDDGSGQPALSSYEELLEDLRALKSIITNEQQVDTDIEAFETWFRNAATTGKVSAKEFAERYFALRTGRDAALRIIAANERIIDRLDLRIRANTMAGGRLADMMHEPGYGEAVLAARKQADVVVRSLYDPTRATEDPIGLINRDRAGKWELIGPMSKDRFVVDLHPSAAGEAENVAKLGVFITEARAWALQNANIDPLKAQEYNDLAGYIEGHLMSASLNPKAGFTMTRVRLPFTDIRIPLDPFDWLTSATGTFGFSFHTVRDVLERIGGRTVIQAVKDAAVLDTTMRKVEGVDQNTTYGRAAQTEAVLKAVASHGWEPDQIKRWNSHVAEPVLAAGQNRLSPGYHVGDVIVGSNTTLTSEDVAALNLMKRWSDGVSGTAPHSIEDRLGELGITRKQIGNGKYAGPRIEAEWTRNFLSKWMSATTDAAKRALLTEDEEFRNVVLGYLGEYNPEFANMNPASSEKSSLFELYRRLANTEKAGVDTFRDWQEVVRFLAMEGVRRQVFPDYTTGADQVNTILFDEIKAFITAFNENVIKPQPQRIWGAVPPGVVNVIAAQNSFTTPRSRLLAPSTFYSYSMALASRQQNYVGSLRSLLNLKMLQSAYEAKGAMESKLTEMNDKIEALVATGISQRKARKLVKKESVQQRKRGEIRYDYRELLTALQAIEQTFLKNVERYELQASDHYEHAGVAAANSFFSSIKASLLSGLQAISTNYWSGALLGPALGHWQAGQYGRAVSDIAVQPYLMSKVVLKRVSAMLDNNPLMARLLRTHAPMWDEFAQAIINGAADWRHIQKAAQSSGMVNPYNLKKVLANMGELKSTAGRFTADEPNRVAEFVNSAMSTYGIRHVAEATKAFVPRVFDNAINYMMVLNWDREVELLKKVGWNAFQAREHSAAATGANWTDLSKEENILTPGDLGLKSYKALEWFRQLFVPLGSLDGVLRDYYERTKNMPQDQREAEPLLSEDDHNALGLQYAAKSNVSVETNRPYSMKGKGSDGVWRNVIGTFLGWGVNMMHQLSKGMQSHSKDPDFPRVAHAFIGLATIVFLMTVVGAWNWEFGDEWSKLFYGQSSSRIQIGNIQDWQTGLKYLIQSIVNTIPMMASAFGGLFGVGPSRGNVFDVSSWSPHVGFVSGAYNTAKRILQTGDVTLPMADFSRQWIPMSKIVLNRLPTLRGLVDQQNAVRSMLGSAPPGTEIKWGQRGGGNIKYSPANDEVQRVVASAYEVAAHGGNPAIVQQRLQQAVAAYVAAGRSQEDAEKALVSALAAKEPIRVLTGREMTPEEEARWTSRMTRGQREDYDRAVAAWRVLSDVTGRDFNMISTKGGGGGGGVSAPIRPQGGGRAGAGGVGGVGLSGVGNIGGGNLFRPVTGFTGIPAPRSRGSRSSSLRRGRSNIGGSSRRRTGPRVVKATSRRRRTGSRRRPYTLL